MELLDRLTDQHHLPEFRLAYSPSRIVVFAIHA